METDKRMRVVWLDDDAKWMENHLFQLHARNIDVHFLSCSRTFLSEMGTFSDAALVVLDMMIPVPDDLRVESADGICAGLVLAKRLRTILPNMPIVFFSNAWTSAPGAQPAQEFENATFLSKSTYTPEEFAEIIASVLATGIPRGGLGGVLNRMFDCLVLQPGIAGFSVDLRKLAKYLWKR